MSGEPSHELASCVLDRARGADNGKFILSVGISAGIDAALNLVAYLHGLDGAVETVAYG
jgi:transcriptional regulator GlxA family with amidase domain